MSFRFQQRVTIFPGVRLNFSRSGVSATLGPRGASITVGRRGQMVNLGIPGTGLSFRKRVGGGRSRGSRRQREAASGAGLRFPSPAPAPQALTAAATAIESAPVEEISSDGLETLRELILGAQRERESVLRQIPNVREEKELARRRVRWAQSLLLRWLLQRRLPGYLSDLEAKTAELSRLEERLEGCFIDADIDLDPATIEAFEELTEAFERLASAAAIWDITSTAPQDRVRTRSAASVSLERRPVRFGVSSGGEGVLQTEADGLRLENANGADIVVYPGFVLMHGGSSLALIDLREVELEYAPTEFIESEAVPRDGEVVGQVWAKSNRDGSPDRRFKENFQIPVARYGRLRLTSAKGLNEAYMVSDAAKAESFARAFAAYQRALETFTTSTGGAR